MEGNFSIDTKNTLQSAKELGDISRDIQVLAKRIETCNIKLSSSQGGFAVIGQKIGGLYEEVLNESVQMESLQKALENIVSLYAQCERKICSGEGKEQSEREKTPTGGTDKRGFLEKLLDDIFGEDKDRSYTATTDEQEKAADEEMQKKLQEVLASDKYSEDAWKNATADERKKILEEYMKEVEGILGIDVKDSINYFYEEPENGMITNGYYTDSKNRVSINSYIIDTYSAEDSYFLFTTVTHEMRHAYQHEAVDHPTDYQVSEETIDKWEDNFDNYISSDEDYNKYRNQPVESDARQFAGQK